MTSGGVYTAINAAYNKLEGNIGIRIMFDGSQGEYISKTLSYVVINKYNTNYSQASNTIEGNVNITYSTYGYFSYYSTGSNSTYTGHYSKGMVEFGGGISLSGTGTIKIKPQGGRTSHSNTLMVYMIDGSSQPEIIIKVKDGEILETTTNFITSPGVTYTWFPSSLDIAIINSL